MNEQYQIEYAALLASKGQPLPSEHSNSTIELLYKLFDIENNYAPTSLPDLKRLSGHQCFPKVIQTPMDQYVHTKYTDILQDYTYLPNNEVIELVSRKLTLIPKDSPEDSISQLLVKELALKVATLATIAGGDYRRGGLIRMIRKWRDLLLYLLEWSSIVSNEYICQIISLLIDDSDELLEIEDIDETQLPNWRCLIPQGGISNNFRQVKILVLPRYYLSIYFDRLVKLLGMGEGGGGSVDNRLELLIMDMILRNSLPLGSKIDQKKGVLIFGTLVEPPTGQAQMNNHITQVQQLLTEAVSLIP